MLLETEWLPAAQALPVGKSTTIQHCGSNRTLSVHHEPDRYWAYCFRCKGSYHERIQLSIGERLQLREERLRADKEAQLSVTMPAGIRDINHWPDYARVWLHKAGLSRDDIWDHEIIYSPHMNRVVIPVFGYRNELIYWQARGFSAFQPKYLSPGGVDREFLLPTFGKDKGTVVLTEDLLSAIKVGLVGYSACLMGTRLFDPVLAWLVRGLYGVIIALDPDKAGIDASRDIANRLRAFGVTHANITEGLEADPKLLSRDAIRDTIERTKVHMYGTQHWPPGSSGGIAGTDPSEVSAEAG